MKIVAEALKNTAAQYGSFVARYGGDEFCFISDRSKIASGEIPESLSNFLKEAQEKMMSEKNMFYPSVSANMYTPLQSQV